MLAQPTIHCLSRAFLALLLTFPALLHATEQEGRGSEARVTEAAKPFPFSELGAKATADYKGDAIGITATAEGATLRTGLQKLAGTVTSTGLRLESTEAEGGSLSLTASAVGRVMQSFQAAQAAPATSPPQAKVMQSFQAARAAPGQSSAQASSRTKSRDAHAAWKDCITLLPTTGIVTSTAQLVTFTRPGLIEQYSVSADGVRQDFIIAQRPAGTAQLSVELTLSGATAEATAEATADGAKLTLTTSQRALAYNRLQVTDANGQTLPATLAVLSPTRLAVQVQDENAIYPLRIDPTFSDADWVSISPGFPGANGSVSATAVDGGGNLYIGGDFNLVGSIAVNRVAKWNGSTWSALGSGVDGGVSALAMVGGDLYVGGSFTTAGGAAANRIAKWNGSVWSVLSTGMNEQVSALTVNGSDLYVGGGFTTAGGVPANYIAKWNGVAWSALGSGMDGSVNALAVSGGNLYAGGYFIMAGGIQVNRIAKWNGVIWSPLGSGIDGSAYVNIFALAVNGNTIYAGGVFQSAGGVSANHIARWDGSEWSNLASGMSGGVYALALRGSDLYAGGSFRTSGGTTTDHIAKWNGSEWMPLGLIAGTTGNVYALAVSGNELYVGGYFFNGGDKAARNIAKCDGSAWSALGQGMGGHVNALAVSGNDLYAGVSSFVTAGETKANYLAKWNGSSWSALGSGVNSDIYAIAVSGSDLYAGGDFTMADGTTVNHIAKWNGTIWSPLGSGMNDTVYELAVSGSVLYAGGDFTTADGTTVNHIAKWNGTSWSALSSGMDDSVGALAMSGSDLYAGGSFTRAGGTAVDYIAKWNGSSWSALGSGMDGSVTALAVSGGNLYAGGLFSRAGSVGANHIAKWNGSAWSALGSGMNSYVYALAVSGNDLYAGGDFTMVAGTPVNRIAKWNGTAWSALGSGIGPLHYFNSLSSSVYALAIVNPDYLYIGGSFLTAGTTVSPFIAQANLPLTPTVTAVIPVSGSSAGGTRVTITGTSFAGATAVNIGGVAATNVVVVNATTITATAPAHAAAAVSVVVFAHGDFNAPNALYTYAHPHMEVSGNGVTIANADTTPTVSDYTDFGDLSLLSAQVTRSFSITNTGLAEIGLTGTPKVEITGSAAVNFVVTTQPTSPVAVAGSTTFQITFAPNLLGPMDATVSIKSNDPGSTPYIFAISGYGVIEPQTITFSPPSMVYLGQRQLDLTSTASSGLPVQFAIVSGLASLIGNSLNIVGAGTVTVTASQPGNGIYSAAASVTRSIVVVADPAALTLVNLAQTYDGNPKPIAIQQALSLSPVITYKVGASYVATAPTAAGSYAVKAVAGAVVKTGTLVIAKAVLTVTPDDKRKFAGQANPALSSVITGYVGGDTSAVVTKAALLTTTATLASVGGVYPIKASGAVALNYAFNYQVGSMVVESFAGSYEALLVDAVPLLVGKLSITVAASSTTFTAKLASGSTTGAVAFKGSLITDPVTELATGSASTTVVINKVSTPFAISFSLPLSGAVLASATRNAVALGTAADGRKLLKLATGQKVSYTGAHTAVFGPATPMASGVPVGAGWATASVSTAGVMTLTGKLGDGVAFTSTLSPDGDASPGYRLFAQPYVAARVQSFVAGAFTLAAHPNPSSNASLVTRRYVAGAGMTWQKSGLPADVAYRAGFGPVTSVLTLDPWLPPVLAKAATKTVPAVSAITLADRLGLSGGSISFGASHSATGSAANGNLPTRLGLSATNAVSVLLPVTTPVLNSTKWKTLSFSATTGAFTGSFELLDDPVKRPVTFSGVLRQPATALDTMIGDGHYLLPPLIGTEKTTGEVMFTRP